MIAANLKNPQLTDVNDDVMEKAAFKMKLKPGFEKEYIKRHDTIWPELKSELIKAGIREYVIYLDKETGILFAFQKLNDDHNAGDLPQKPVVQKWWDYMKDLMDVNPDHSPVTTPLIKAFDLD